jgi:glycosyltransferase involved in cell wall biosynthesis
MAVFKPEKEAEDSIVLNKNGLDGDYLLAVGASCSHKNTGNLLAAFRKVQVKHKNIRLCIVGYNSDYLDPLTEGEEYRGIVKIPYVSQREIVMFY